MAAGKEAGVAFALRGIRCVYREKKVLEIHDLVVRAGRITAVIGESGSGKSTLLNVLGRLTDFERASNGFMHRTMVTRSGVHRHFTHGRGSDAAFWANIAWIFQRGYLLGDASVRANLNIGDFMPGAYRGRKAKQDMLGRFRIGSSFLATPAKFLSGGEQQRVAFARALLGNPRIVIADEPTASLDGPNEKAIFNYLQRFVADGDGETSVILATHQMQSVVEYADDFIVVREGEPVRSEDGWPRPVAGHSRLDLERLRDGKGPFEPYVPTEGRSERGRGEAKEDAVADRDGGEPAEETKPRPSPPRRIVTAAGIAIDELFAWPEVGAGQAARASIGILYAAIAAMAGVLVLAGFDVWLGVLFGAGFGAIVAMRPWLARFRERIPVVFLLLLIVSLGASYKTWTIFEALGQRQLTDPSLSHVVLTGDRSTFPLNSKNLARLKDRIEELGFAGCETPIAGTDWAGCRGERFLFGRYESTLLRAGPARRDAGGDIVCGKADRPVELLAARIEEPAFSRLAYYTTGETISKMRIAANASAPDSFVTEVSATGSAGAGANNLLAAVPHDQTLLGAIVTMRFLRNHLDLSPDDQPPRWFCLSFDRPERIPVIRVVEQLPQSDVSRYDVAISTRHFNDAKGRSATKYHNAAFYFSAEKAAEIKQWLSADDGPFGGGDDRKVYAGSGVEKILEAIGLWQTSRYLSLLAVGILIMIMIISTVVMTKLFVVENERALCVMRVFAWRTWDITTLVATRLIVTLTITSMIYLTLLVCVVEFVDEFLRMTYDLLPQDVGSSVTLLVVPLAITCVVSLVSVALRVWWWTRSSRFPADRLKEVD